MSSKESANAEKRILIDSVRKTLRGFFFILIALTWLTFIILFLRVDFFTKNPSLIGLWALTVFLALPTGAAHFFRDATFAWIEYPFWSDEYHFNRDHRLISLPIWGVVLVLLVQFLFTSVILPVIFLLTVDFVSVLFFPPLAQWLCRFVRKEVDDHLFTAEANNAAETTDSVVKGGEADKVAETHDSVSKSCPTLPFQKAILPISERAELSEVILPETDFQPSLFAAVDESEEKKTIKIGDFVERVAILPEAGETDTDEEEFEEEEPEIPPPVDMFLSQNRFSNDDGERIEGWVRVPFLPEEETAVVHLSFCPPMKTPPRLELIQLSGPDVQIVPTRIELFGARIEVKRRLENHLDDEMEKMTVSGGFPDESVRICFFAVAPT